MEYNILRDWLSNHQFTWEKLGDILTYHHNAPILFSSGLFFFLFIGFLMIYMSLRKHTLARIIIKVVDFGSGCWYLRLLPIS